MIPLSFHQSRPEYSARIAATAIFTKLRKVGTPEVPLSELIESTQYGYTASATETPVGPHFVRITDLKEGAICWPTVPFCECGDVATYRIEEGDLLFARTGATTGKTHLVSEPPPVESVFASYLIRVRPKPTTSAAYLNAFFQSDVYWQQLVDYKSGSAQANVNATKLATLQVPVVGEETQKAIARFMKAVQERSLNPSFPLPPLPSPLSEQQEIVGWIDAVATRVEEAKTAYELTSEMRHGFVSSLHVSLSEDRGTKIKDFLELDEDRVLVEQDGEYPQIGLRGFGGGMFYRETLKGDQTKYKHFNRLYDGAIILSQVKGWEGAIAVTPTDFKGHYSSPEYRTFRCKETVLPEYLAALIQSPWFWKQLAELTRGVGARRERIRPDMFLEMEINMPPLDDQRKALEMYRRLNQTEALRESIPSQLEAILPSVLNETFNGGDQ